MPQMIVNGMSVGRQRNPPSPDIFWAEFVAAKCVLFTGIGWRRDAKLWAEMCAEQNYSDLATSAFPEDIPESEHIDTGEDANVTTAMNRISEMARRLGMTMGTACDATDETETRSNKRLARLCDAVSSFKADTVSTSSVIISTAVAKKWINSFVEHNAQDPQTKIVNAFVDMYITEATDCAQSWINVDPTNCIGFIRKLNSAWYSRLGDATIASRAKSFIAVVTADARRWRMFVGSQPDVYDDLSLRLKLEQWKTKSMEEALDAAHKRAQMLMDLVVASNPTYADRDTISIVKNHQEDLSHSVTSRLIVATSPVTSRAMADKPELVDAATSTSLLFDEQQETPSAVLLLPNDEEPLFHQDGYVLTDELEKQQQPTVVLPPSPPPHQQQTNDFLDISESTFSMLLGYIPEFKDDDCCLPKPSETEFASRVSSFTRLLRAFGTETEEERLQQLDADLGSSIKFVSKVIGWITWHRTTMDYRAHRAEVMRYSDADILYEKVRRNILDIAHRMFDNVCDANVGPATTHATDRLRKSLIQAGEVARRKRKSHRE